MAATYDLSTDVGKVRAIIPDPDIADATFSDEEIEAYLSIEAGSLKRAAALALEVKGTDEAFVLKVLKRLDVQTDGAKLGDFALKRAAALRAQADKADELLTEDEWDGLEVIEMITNPFNAREYAWNEYLRGAV
jgi:hypothetical protein